MCACACSIATHRATTSKRRTAAAGSRAPPAPCRRWQHGSVLFRPAPVATGAAEGRAGRVRRPRAEDCHRRAQFKCIGACRPNYKAEQDTCPCLSVASTGFITTTPSEGLAFFFPPPLFLCRHGDIHSSPPREGGVCGILTLGLAVGCIVRWAARPRMPRTTSSRYIYPNRAWPAGFIAPNLFLVSNLFWGG